MEEFKTPKCVVDKASPEAKARFEHAVNRLRGTLCPCICEADDVLIVKEGGEIWQNMDMIKYSDHKETGYISFRTDTCPLCGRWLPVEYSVKSSHMFKKGKVY